MLGHLGGCPAALLPHGGHLPRRLEDGVAVTGASEHLPVDVGGGLRGQIGDQRRVEGGILIGWRLALGQALGHAGGACRGHGVDRDAVLTQLDGPNEGHPHDGGLGRSVVALTEVAPQAGRGGDVHDAAVAGLLHQRGGVTAGVEGSLLVHGHHGVVVGFVHLHQGAVPYDPGVVDQDVDLPVGVHRGADDAAGGIEVVDAVAAGHRRTTPGLDLAHHLLGRVLPGALSAQRHTDVVDHHAGALVGQAEGDGTTDAPTGSRDDGDPSFEQAHSATVREHRLIRHRRHGDGRDGAGRGATRAPHRPHGGALASPRSAGVVLRPGVGGGHP